MREIRDGGNRLVVYIPRKEPLPQQFWYGEDSNPLQWGIQTLSERQVIQPHIHKERNRQFKSKTVEVFVLLAGKMKVDIYSVSKTKLTTLVMRAGDVVVAYDGGHGFQSLSADTRLLEVKLGPFTTVEDDKEKF